MADPIFGSVSQLWPATQFPYLQTPMLFSSRTPGFVPSGVTGQGAAPFAMGPMSSVPTATVPNDQTAFSTGVMPPFGGPHYGSGLSAVISTPVGTMPAFTGTEIAIGVTAPALLTAVAMRRGQPLGPTNDQEIEDFIYDALDLIPGTSDVEVRLEGGRATLTGSVPHKRLKRDVGEIAWAIPTLNDVQNNVTITARRRTRTANREEAQPAAGRKQP
jgi:BON domain